VSRGDHRRAIVQGLLCSLGTWRAVAECNPNSGKTGLLPSVTRSPACHELVNCRAAPGPHCVDVEEFLAPVRHWGQVRKHEQKTPVCQSRGHFWEELVVVTFLTRKHILAVSHDQIVSLASLKCHGT